MKHKFKTFSEELSKQLKELSQEEIKKKAIIKRMKKEISLKNHLKHNNHP